MRIGVLGGTFNPIHHAHIQMACFARDMLSLDRVLLMVAADPPHKVVDGHVSAQHRFSMTKLAVESIPQLEACDLELRRSGKSYMSDTLALLREQYPGAELYLIVGSDMLEDLPNWHLPEEIAAYADIAAIARIGQETMDAQHAEYLVNAYRARVHLLSGNVDRLSSTEIRERLYRALPVDSMLPEAVERYCYETGLYFPKDLQCLQQGVRSTVNEKRYIHTMGTVRAAVGLAYLWHVNACKARLSALLHDCAKSFDPVTLAVLGGDDTGIRSVQHAFAGAVVAHNTYRVDDQEVLRAIRLHSTGDANMTSLDKLLYLADLTEPNRNFPGVDTLRSNLLLGEDHAMLLALHSVKKRVQEMCLEGTESSFHPAGDRAIQYFTTLTNEAERSKQIERSH